MFTRRNGCPGSISSIIELASSPLQSAPLKDRRGFNLISDALPCGRLWYGEPDAIGYAGHRSRSHDAMIRVYDDAGNEIETHEHTGDFKEWWVLLASRRTFG